TELTAHASARLAAQARLAKAMREMGGGQRAAQPPVRRDVAQRQEHERALLQRSEGDGEAARANRAAVPGENVEVEDAGPPALAAAPTEGSLYGFEGNQKRG